MDYKYFTVYSQNDNPDTAALIKILDSATLLLDETNLLTPDFRQKIFLTGSFGEFTFLAPMSRKAFAVNYPFAQNIIFSKTSIFTNRVFANRAENNLRSLSSVITHETTHSLLENKLGLIMYRMLPSWKNEGYCDYISKESSFDEHRGLSIMCSNA